MKIISWNVAGLRACYKKGLEDFFNKELPDILCIQESKVLPEQNPFHIDGYKEYLFPAKRKGYSGTLIYSKVEPLSVKYGIDDTEYDDEGRTITLEFHDFYLVTCYVPNTKRNLERMDSRMRFEGVIKDYLNKLKEKKNVVYCGDLNVAHEEIDIRNPKANERNAGFTIEERTKMTELLSEGYIDTFRYLYKDKVEYSWWSYLGHARENNVGWRLDYFIVNKEFISNVKDSTILTDVYGSDHAPISLIIG